MGGAYAASKEGFLAEAFPAWVAAARAALQARPQVANESAQVELLSASVKTLSAALRSQRATTSGAAGTLVLVGAPLAAAAYYLRNHGWWVTAQELQEGLDGVRRGVCERLEEVRVQLLERIGILELQGEETAAWQRRQSNAMARLDSTLQGVHDAVGTLEERHKGVEGDVARSARGVELLCEFVAGADAPSGENARPSLQERLHEFTGLTHQPAPARPNPPLPWATPKTSFLTSVLSGRISP